jgi:hypothetical protein
MKQRAALILELYKADSHDEKIPSLMSQRWEALIALGEFPALKEEVRRVFTTTNNLRLKRVAAFDQVRLELYAPARPAVLPISEINEYIELERELEVEPKDQRGGFLLELASQEAKGDKIRFELENRILKKFPASLNADMLRALGRRRANDLSSRKGGYSMQATNDSRVTAGLGDAAEVKKVVIRWPPGVVQVLGNLKIGQEHKVIKPKKTSP